MPTPHPSLASLTKDLRHRQLSRREFLTRATALGLTIPAACSLASMPAPSRAQSARFQKGGVLRVQMSVRPLTDTRSADWPEIANLTRGTLEYLVRYHNSGALEGQLLDSWQVNEDATEYVLHLRDNVTWHDGTPFTARDVVRNFTRWCDRRVSRNSMASRFGALIDPDTDQLRYGAVTAHDARTVVVTLSYPDITLIPSLSDYPAAVTHENYRPGQVDPIGTGPYRIATHTPGALCVLERVADHRWWGTEVSGGPFLDRIEYHDFGTDPANWVQALNDGAVDMLHESVGQFIETLDAAGFDKYETQSAATIVIRANQQAEVNGTRPYADPMVRQALALAVDNAICLELGYANRGTVAENHHASPLHPEYALMPPPPYDPDTAVQMLSEAGMADVTHELASIDDDWHMNTADAVAAQLQDAGIKTDRRILPGETYWQEWKSLPFSTTSWNHRPLAVQIWTLAYQSGAAWNEFGWSNAEFDDLLEQAVAIWDADKRREIARDLQALLRQDAVMIQPYWRAIYRHQVAGLLGTTPHVSFEHHHESWGWAQ